MLKKKIQQLIYVKQKINLTNNKSLFQLKSITAILKTKKKKNLTIYEICVYNKENQFYI